MSPPVVVMKKEKVGMREKSPPPGELSEYPAYSFECLACEFREYHRNALNVVLHLVTTPLGWVCALRLLGALGLVEAIVVFHTLMVALTAPLHLGVLTAVANAVAYAWSETMGLGMVQTAGLLAVSYVAQDVSHWITAEPTFQSSYSDPVKFCLHTVYLLPLCFDAYFNLPRGPLYWLVPRNTTITARIPNIADLALLRKWVFASNPSKSTTTHWWYSDLKGSEKGAFDRVAASPAIREEFDRVWGKAYAVDVVHGMNEVYVASPTQMASSDKVFLMYHIDGPWIVWPFCSVYRVLAAVNENVQVSTHLKEIRSTHTLTTGDVLGFDFNRELHKVSFDERRQNNEPRITLKLHYVVYPKCLAPFGWCLAWLTTRYDELARRLFLYTIQPKTVWQKMSARIGVLLTTYLFEQFESRIGLNNVVRAVAVMGAATAAGVPVLYATSFVHYLIYIATYYYRVEVNYGRLLRDCMFWKGLAMCQLYYHYAVHHPQTVDPVTVTSAVMIVLGYGLAASATAAIGIDRTYFASELGMVPRKWINRFPYTSIPHPMILGAVVALLGFHLATPFRQAFPYLVPTHIALYVLHALQEHFDIHDTTLSAPVKSVRC